MGGITPSVYWKGGDELESFHHLDKALEVMHRIVWARSRFRMVLN